MRGTLPRGEMLVQAPTTPGWNPSAPHEIRAAVCQFVSDGDTIKTDDGETIRLLGINAPEIPHEARAGRAETKGESYGMEAKSMLADAIQGKEILLIVPQGPGARDRYGRLLALVVYKDRLINLLLIENGYAEPYELGNLDLLNIADFREAQARAEEAKINLYSIDPRRRGLRPE